MVMPMQSNTTICPYCTKPFPLVEQFCMCGGYRVNEDNFTQSFKQRFGGTFKKITGGGNNA